MPTPERIEAPPYELWLAEHLVGPVAFVALENGRLDGYAALCKRDAVPTLLEHGFTAVRRSHRGRGIATALKRAQITWAATHGYRELITYTQEGNKPMRAVNEKLGYRANLAWITVRRKAV
jgi:GNAT superfamily N-acetyltransferase